MLFSAVGEGGEEVIADVLNPILKTMTYDPEGYKDYGTPEYWSNMLRDGIIGAGLGAVGGGGQVVRAVGETAQSAKARNGEMLITAEVETLAGALKAATDAEEPAETVQQGEVVPNEKKPITPVEAIARVAQGKAGNENEQLNIDNTANRNYTEKNDANGGAQNVSGRSLEADSDGISGVYAERNADYQGQRGFDSVPIDSGHVLSAQAQKAIQSRGVDIVETKDVSANSAAFSAALDESRAANAQNGWAATPKSTQEIAVNGTYYVIETVPDTAKKTNFIVSAYMLKKGA